MFFYKEEIYDGNFCEVLTGIKRFFRDANLKAEICNVKADFSENGLGEYEAEMSAEIKTICDGTTIVETGDRITIKEKELIIWGWETRTEKIHIFA